MQRRKPQDLIPVASKRYGKRGPRSRIGKEGPGKERWLGWSGRISHVAIEGRREMYESELVEIEIVGRAFSLCPVHMRFSRQQHQLLPTRKILTRKIEGIILGSPVHTQAKRVALKD